MATATKSTATVEAEAFVDAAHAAGFHVSVKPGLVTIRATFEPGDRDAYVAFDGDAEGLLAGVPTVTSGSTWGTDSASVGGYAGLNGGYYRLQKSGVSKRFTTALAKVLGR